MLRTVLFRPAILQPRFHQRTVTTSAPNFTFFNELYADLSKSSLVANTQHLIESVHDYTHLPWWASIVITTVSLRLAITLPLAAYQVLSFIVILENTEPNTLSQHTIYAKLENLKPEMDGILKDLKKETDRAVVMYRWDAKTAKIAFHKSVPLLFLFKNASFE